MLWDIIRDWFVQYIFGGVDSAGVGHDGLIGGGVMFVSSDENASNYFTDTMTTTYGHFRLPNVWAEDSGLPLNPCAYISMGDWLSTTATIITLIAGCVLLFLMLKWLFKLFAGMISGVGR